MSIRRLLLFDIDGTLIWGGPAKDAFCRAMIETFGTAGDLDGVGFGGKTDPQIARELLAGAGRPAEEIDAGLPGLFDRYTSYLESGLVDRPVTILPGVEELLDALAAWEDIGLALLTGNIYRGAQLKLGSVGLLERFALGSYGSDSEERNDLPAIALRRAREHWGNGLTAADAIVVGDTPRDVECGHREGMRTLAVATGLYGQDALVDAGASHVLPDLSATQDVVSLLTA